MTILLKLNYFRTKPKLSSNSYIFSKYKIYCNISWKRIICVRKNIFENTCGPKMYILTEYGKLFNPRSLDSLDNVPRSNLK